MFGNGKHKRQAGNSKHLPVKKRLNPACGYARLSFRFLVNQIIQMARKEKYGKSEVLVKHKRKSFSKEERLFIFNRDNYTCQLCKKDLTELPTERILDHKIPLSQLGSNKLTNIWLLCSDCDKNKKSEILPCAIDARLKELQNGRKTTSKRIVRNTTTVRNGKYI